MLEAATGKPCYLMSHAVDTAVFPPNSAIGRGVMATKDRFVSATWDGLRWRKTYARWRGWNELCWT